MVSGTLALKNGYYYAVLSYRDAAGKRHQKWVSTGLPQKGNKRWAEQELIRIRSEFEIPPAAGELNSNMLFADYLDQWLEVVRARIKPATFGSYQGMVKSTIGPYFRKKELTLKELEARHIQQFYTEKLKTVTPNSVIHYHAVIYQALKYAMKTDMVPQNVAMKVDRPRKNSFQPTFLDAEQMQKLFEIVKGTRLELPVLVAAFYGLRRGEVLGLKWDAIDFNRGTLTIKRTVTEATIDGTMKIIEQDSAKTKSSLRTLPLVGSFRDYFQKVKEAQELNKKVCGNCYNYEYDGYVFVNELGDKMIFTQASADDGETHLYSRIKLIDKWEDAQPLEGLSETGHNQNYPFMASDGITLYFGAEGDESMGGYDIFVTRYDSDDNSYLRPDNIGMPFNSPYNDYMYALDDLNNLGWFASDRYQPEGKVCVYVFVPNETKQVYDYENTDPQTIIDVASLREIKKTWSDDNKVRIAKQHLAQVMYGENTEKKKGDFRFVVDDNAVYHTLSDFRSKEARQMYASLLQKEKDLASLEASLENLRTAYQQSNKAGKEKLTPGILDKEKRTNELRHELEELTFSVRNAELKALKQ